MATTKKRKSTAALNEAEAGRPFDAKILTQAAEIAAEYQIILRVDKTEGWCGRCVELPLVVGFGEDPNSCVDETRELIATTVAIMLENGQVLPTPASDETRTEQLNVRLTPAEKYRLEDAAKRSGFRGLSDYVRAAALRRE